MNAAILLALVPALAWGSVGLVNTKMGGSAGQQTLGMTFGALIFGLGTMFFYVMPNHAYMGSEIWVVGLVSGLVWAVGTAGQFLAIKDLGVSLAIPLSTAGQIVTNALMAAIVLGDWKTGRMWAIGVISIIAVVIGATLISARDRALNSGINDQVQANNMTKGLVYLAISTAGFMFYFVLPNFLNKIGYISDTIKSEHNGVDYMTAIVGPQAFGQVIGAFLIVIFVLKEADKMFAKPTWKNIVTGLVWAIGNIFMFISAANPAIGQTIATTFSQLGIIVATFGGIYLLGEKKSSYQMRLIVIGTILVVVGAIIIGNINSFT
ncbi:GRP family sugar transporter [Leuconostoc carnosum]|uniref:Glucose transporter n=2 Tax=Leuconostoc carnosum TaxID=1252 RepID=A0AAE6M4D6_LEUCA|nr:GRP family sugar transporter [Leuconostoc carnosum]AFT82243.1 putative glucose uptake permease [Leuconostoc carnosum JB16]KAA8327767.1 glucose transporter [Leuconostoc carnosum]KAA8366491.1 glucose transporter [Leuconostoc carnosum]KAA8369779.1 glucose transporter [Leuconostoc carnosum]KAA8371874.1 glucose transporter [Leuconostoc carnosum]